MDRWDADVVVIGGGIAGQTAARELVTGGLAVTLIEQDIPGRQHARTGDLMLQVLSRAGELVTRVRLAERYGVSAELSGVNYPQLVRRRDEVVQIVLGGRPAERLQELGIRVVGARGRLRGPGEVEADGSLVRCRAVVLATGSVPHVPKLPGLEATGYLTPEQVLGYYHLPSTIAVLGGGAVGVTFAQVFSRFSVGVHLVERSTRLLVGAEPEISDAMAQVLQESTVQLLTGWEAYEAHREGTERVLALRRVDTGEEKVVIAEALLLAAGRDPAIHDLGLETAGVQVGPRGVLADAELQTTAPGIWGCGDVVGVYHLSHMAEYEARVVAHNVAASLAGRSDRQTAQYGIVPWTYPTDPEVAQVGLREEEARALGGPVVVGMADFASLNRAVTLGDTRGLVKVVADGVTGKLLGAHILGLRAGELISEASVALRAGLTVHDLAATPHPALALAEGLRRAAARAADALG